MIESSIRFVSSHPLQFGSDFFFRQDDEPKVLVQWPVPRHFTEGSECDRRAVRRNRPGSYPLEQRPPHPMALKFRKNADLGNVGIPVNFVHEDVGHRLVRAIDSDPAPSADRICRQFSFGTWLVIGDGRQPDHAEHLSGRPLDLPKRWTVIWTSRTDLDHAHHVACIYASGRRHTLTCEALSPVNGERSHHAHRCSRVIPAIRAIRSSSAGHTYRKGAVNSRKLPSSFR